MPPNSSAEQNRIPNVTCSALKEYHYAVVILAKYGSLHMMIFIYHSHNNVIGLYHIIQNQYATTLNKTIHKSQRQLLEVFIIALMYIVIPMSTCQYITSEFID